MAKPKHVKVTVRMRRKHATRFVQDHLPGADVREVLTLALELGLAQLRVAQHRPRGQA